MIPKLKRCLFCYGGNVTGFEWCSLECHDNHMIMINSYYEPSDEGLSINLTVEYLRGNKSGLPITFETNGCGKI